MLTKEQEEKIIEIAATTWINFPGSYSKSIGAAVAVGIRAYDEMKDVEDVKATANAENDNDSGAYVVFRPSCLTTEESMQNVRVFNSIEEMVTKLKEEKKANIYIEEEEHKDCWTKWQHCHYVLYGSECFKIHAGVCDCKTFKRG